MVLEGVLQDLCYTTSNGHRKELGIRQTLKLATYLLKQASACVTSAMMYLAHTDIRYSR